MRRASRGLVLVVIALAATGVPGGNESDLPRVEVGVEPPEGTVGDLLEVSLRLTVPAGTGVRRPEIGPEWGSFSVREPSWEGPEPEEEGERWIWRGSVAAFETGPLELPAVEIRLTGPEGERTIRSEPVQVVIRSVLESEEPAPGLSDLKPAASLRPELGPLWTAAGIVLGLVALSAVAWWLHRRYGDRFSKVETPADPFQRMAPHVWAYAELQHLLEKRLGEDGQVDRFYEELSRVLKLYLSGRFRIELMERTTDESPPILRQAGVPREAAISTRALLETCDQVKFARELPDARARREAVDRAYRIVDATKPHEPSEAHEKGAA